MNDETLKAREVELEQAIAECERLKKEWEERIQEAIQARDNFNSLIKELST